MAKSLLALVSAMQHVTTNPKQYFYLFEHLLLPLFFGGGGFLRAEAKQFDNKVGIVVCLNSFPIFKPPSGY